MVCKSYHLHHFKFLVINTSFLFNIILRSTLASKYKTEDLVEILLGPTKEVKDYQKYKRLKNNDKSFYNCYEIALAKIQTRIMKRHRELKENPSSNKRQLIENAELLLDQWGTTARQSI